MCLGIPGKVIRWIERTPLFATAQIEFGGIEKPCNMTCVPDANVGDFVIVHAGVAIAIIDQHAAARALQEFESIAEIEDRS